ncbi:hypothetical protein J2Y73_003273 [Peribacillus frigoritolerans]|nr:hypothetical protein [Peribacillus frigoritolerans]
MIFFISYGHGDITMEVAGVVIVMGIVPTSLLVSSSMYI